MILKKTGKDIWLGLNVKIADEMKASLGARWTKFHTL